ncbi:MAG: hypothetical protein HKN39_06705 [Flavobacteriales bacterium]|nr:hypothetical protein [Flavobacteriales bacterium]
MKAVKVQYTVKPDFVEQNKINIKKVMDKLKNDPIPGMMYSTYTIDSGNTFVHINMARDGETMLKLNEIEEFGAFRKALKESGPLSPPKQTELDPVAAGFEL